MVFEEFTIISSSRLWSSIGSPLGFNFGNLLASNMASRGPKTAPRRPWEPPRRLLYASSAVPAPPKTPLRPPKTPPRLSKSLQDGSVSLQELSRRGFLRPQTTSKSSLEEPSKPLAVALQPRASGLQVASAGFAKRKQFAVPSGVLDPRRFASYLVNFLPQIGDGGMRGAIRIKSSKR